MDKPVANMVLALIAWLEKRGQPDSGIRYEGPSTGGAVRSPARVELHGEDANFVVKHFHGQGARVLAAELSRLSAENAELRKEIERRDQSFDLRWKSDMRAIERWHKATGRTMVLPDHTDLSVWLFGQLEAAEARLSDASKAIKALPRSVMETSANNGDVFVSLNKVLAALDSQGGGNG